MTTLATTPKLSITQKDNLNILQSRECEYNKIEGARVGDYLLLPYGIYTRFTHKWEEANKIQTGGLQESFYLGNGYISYSGGLDNGIKLNEIERIDEMKPGYVWFFDNDRQGAGRGVSFEMNFRVFKPILGADLSGIPQIKAYEKKSIQMKAETVTRINGNGQPYTLPLPEVIIQADELNTVFLSHLIKNTGMEFKKGFGGYAAQPMKHSQLTTLLLTHNFECKYYNNGSWHNTLFLSFPKNS